MPSNNAWGGSSQTLGYRGTAAASPPNITYHDNNPTIYNTQNFNLGDQWLNTTTDQLWTLIALGQTPSSQGYSLATWVEITGSTGTVTTLTSNSGGAVPPEVGGNLNVVGDGTTITGVGNPGTNTITLSTNGSIATQYITDSGTSNPVAGTEFILGLTGGNISTSGTGAIISIGVSGTTNHALQVGNSTGSLTSLGVGATGTVLQGNTGANPSFTGSPSVSGSVTAATTITAGTGITATTGNITASAGNVVITAGNLVMPASYNSAGTQGVIMWGSNRILTTDGSDTLFLGINAGNTTLTGVNNTVLGNGSFMNATTANHNMLVGNQIMTTATSVGSGNIVVGSASYNVGIGANNCLIGGNSLTSATSATNNTTLGNSTGWDSTAGTGLLTGAGNILIGNGSGAGYRGAESGNIIIDNGTGLNVVGESNVTKIAGIRGVTTNNNNAIAVLIDSAGQLGTVSSSIRFKDNVLDMTDESSSIMNLRPVTFSYKSDTNKDIQYGLIAEEVAEVMPRLAVLDAQGIPETVKYHELPQLILNELIKLSRRVKELEDKLAQ